LIRLLENLQLVGGLHHALRRLLPGARGPAAPGGRGRGRGRDGWRRRRRGRPLLRRRPVSVTAGGVHGVHGGGRKPANLDPNSFAEPFPSRRVSPHQNKQQQMPPHFPTVCMYIAHAAEEKPNRRYAAGSSSPRRSGILLVINCRNNDLNNTNNRGTGRGGEPASARGSGGSGGSGGGAEIGN
jgi:hypothetical protein